jgi:hypothetical protein
LHDAAGLQKPEAKLLFCWSQLLVTDELKRRKRALALTVFDFVEVRPSGDQLKLSANETQQAQVWQPQQLAAIHAHAGFGTLGRLPVSPT